MSLSNSAADPAAWTRGQVIGALILAVLGISMITIGVILMAESHRNEFSAAADSLHANAVSIENLIDGDEKTKVGVPETSVPILESGHCHFSDEILSMAKGVDITKLDLLPVSLKGVEGNPGVKSQLIKLKCDKNFSKIDSEGHLISRIPDQFVPNSYETMSALGATYNANEHTEKRTWDSKTTMGFTVGIELLKLGMFSSSASYERKRNQMISGGSYFSEINLFYLVRSAEFRPPTSRTLALEANEDFQLEVENLSSSFEEDPETYFDLLKKYGTHYFSMARFGGFVKVDTEVTKRLREEMSEDVIQAKLSFSYKMLLKGSMDFDHFENSTEKEFSGMLSSSKYSHGGDASLAFAGKFNEWIQSVPRNPRLIGGKLLPITILIRNTTKRSTMNQAIQIYLGRAYVKDLKACIGIALEKRTGDAYLQRKLLHALSRLSDNALRDEYKLKVLGQEVSLSLRQLPARNVRVEIIRAEGISTAEGLCSYVEFTISPALGTTKDKFPRQKIFETTQVKAVQNPQWNQLFNFTLDYDANIQLCICSGNCGDKMDDMEQKDCAQSTPILTQDHFRLDDQRREQLLRFGNVNLIFSIGWKMASNPDLSDLSPI